MNSWTGTGTVTLTSKHDFRSHPVADIAEGLPALRGAKSKDVLSR